MRISDWSSDVCSSDLLILGLAGAGLALGLGLSYLVGRSITAPLNRTVTALEELGEGHSDTIVAIDESRTEIGRLTRAFNQFRALMQEQEQIGRASCRERVCQYGSITVVAVTLKKKHHKNNY